MSAQIESFSGTHPFSVQCVATSVELDWIDQEGWDTENVRPLSAHWAREVDGALGRSRCPRCRDHLDPTYTAGSRVTICRCIPICPACGSDEAYQPMLGRPMSRIWEWPIGKGHRTRRKNEIEKHAVPAVLDLASEQVLSENGVSRLKLRPNSGGWAEYGHDAEVDR